MKTIKKQEDLIITKIYYFRDQRVMMDEDLAELYGVTTKRLNEQVQRNLERFPEDFMFRLDDQEHEILRSQNATSNGRGGRRYNPYAFTEHGVLMLSSVLNSKLAIAVNIEVVRVFTKLRRAIMDNTELKIDVERIKIKLSNQEKNMEIIFRYLDELVKKPQEKVERKRIGYKPGEW